ncbi:hypothetical protein ASD06_10080 [Angustibacter sp. Root456]|nr:hypothetical protein ASD06_10080 [Angustibacter sp. Root456]
MALSSLSMTPDLRPTVLLVQRLEAQIAALRTLGDEEFATVDGLGLRPILAPVRAVFPDGQAPSARVRQ